MHMSSFEFHAFKLISSNLRVKIMPVLEDYKSNSTVDALTSITDHAMFTIKGMGMNGYCGLLLNILKVIAKYNINIPFITSIPHEDLES